MPTGSGFAFGPFQLDTRGRRLLLHGTLVLMPRRQLDILERLVTHVGKVLTKDQLIQVGWAGEVATDSSLTQVMLRLRRIINIDESPCRINTARGHGYSFVGPVQAIDVRLLAGELEQLLAPHRAFTEGRAALESLSLPRIAEARRTFEQLLLHHAREARVHVGMATACALAFEATRADAAPDVEALRLAETHAHEACALKADYGEAFATLGFVLGRVGKSADAHAALDRAVTLEPYNWYHLLRLANGTWGDERLRAAHRVLELLPGSPMAHLLSATVFIARDALAPAEREVDAGLTAMAAGSDSLEPFITPALHWLKGLFHLTRDQYDDALAAFARELALEPLAHLYARECSANTWYAIGACHRRRGDRSAAQAAFREAIARVPRHPLAHAGLALLGESIARPAIDDGEVSVPMEVTFARAAMSEAAGDTEKGPQLVLAALASSPPGNAGWLLPLEPLLHIARARARWTSVLARLRTRAL